MRALTLWRPWPFVILHYPADRAKRVENRPWKPWSSVIGQRIALHAGKYWDDACAYENGLEDEPRAKETGLVGTAIVKGWVHLSTDLLLPNASDLTHSPTLTRAEAEQYERSHWFFGPYGWVLDEVRALPAPIPWRGGQGLWALPHQLAVELG